MAAPTPAGPVNVALFVTCLVDLFRPSVGFAALKLLESAGCRVAVPEAQTCCGQPAFNAGDRRRARDVAARAIAAFEGYDYVVAPSGSCAAMIRCHFPDLFAAEPAMKARADALAARTWELVSFLTDVLDVGHVEARFDGAATYHDSCSGIRELGIRRQPRLLLATVAGLELRESAGAEVCCGFGGLFCVKYPAIADAMVQDKADAIAATGAATALAGDLGCLLHIAGKLSRAGSPIRVRHVAEVLAGMASGPAIGEAGG